VPWKKSGSGFTTAKGGFVKNPAQYEALKAKGMPKAQAARITNAKKGTSSGKRK
jgi:hypothetical protein